MPFSVSNEAGITGYVVTPVVDGAAQPALAKTLPVGSREAQFPASSVQPKSTIAFQVVAKGNAAQNRTDSAVASCPVCQVALRLSYDGSAQTITAHRGELSASGSLFVNQYQADGTKISYKLDVQAGSSAVVASGDGIPKPLTPSSYVQLVYGAYQSPRYVLPDWQVPQPQTLAAPTGTQLIVTLGEDGSILGGQISFTPSAQDSHVSAYSLVLIKDGVAGTPVNLGKAASYSLSKEELAGVKTLSCQVTAKGDGRFFLDSAPNTMDTQSLLVKFSYDSAGKVIQAVWSEVGTGQLLVLEQNSQPVTSYTFSPLTENPFPLRQQDGNALALTGTWRLKLTNDQAVVSVSPWYTLPAWDVSTQGSSTEPAGDSPAEGPVEYIR